MLTRFVRKQLILFTIISVIGMAVLAHNYLQLPALLGLGRVTVKLELPAAGGLYPFSNVTYRGVKVGEVTSLDVTDGGQVVATLSLDSTPKIPADLVAHVRSMSAVGEQYVELQPDDDKPPFLANGSVIAIDSTTLPQPVGPLLDQVNSLLKSIPQDKLSTIMDESFAAFNGAGYDFGSLLDSTRTMTGNLNGVADQTRALITDSGPVLDSQAQSRDAIRTWITSLSGVTDQVRQNDSQLRTILQEGPGAVDEVTKLLADVKPTLPVLLANLTTVGQVAVTYNASLEQLLVLLPPDIAAMLGVAPSNNPTGIALGDFALTMSDPPACTVGFLPPSSWRSPADETVPDTPDGLYCKLPQDSPTAVRGARNYPCMEHPGKRAPTVELCNSEAGFMPLAQRQHTLGPYPFDPNLIAEGILPDGRVNSDSQIFGPLEGTAFPPAIPPSVPAGPEGVAPTPPESGVPDMERAVAPAGLSTGQPGVGPEVAIAQYNPHTGAYMASDGNLYTQSDLATSTSGKSWTDLVLQQGA